MNIAHRLASFAFAALVASAGYAEDLKPPPARDPATATPVAPPKPRFDLSDKEMKQLLRRVTASEADPRAVEFWLEAWRAPASETRKKVAVPSDPPHPRTAFVECGAINEKCAAYDADGKYLRAVPRAQGLAGIPDLNYRVESGGCLTGNDMLSVFERQERCNGFDRVVPSFWEPSTLRFAPPKTRAD